MNISSVDNNEKLDMATVLVILLKESILKLLNSVAPNLYNHRFYEKLLLNVVSKYIQGGSNMKIDNFIKETTQYDSD